MLLSYRRLKWVALVIVFAVIVRLLIVRTFRPKEWQPSPPYFGPHLALVQDGVNGFLPLHEAQEFCKKRRWEPYATRDQRRKVYDLFLINTELDLFAIRLNELDKEVDYFVVLESKTNLQMNPKPLHLQDNISHFKDFQHKIIHHVLDDSGAKKIPKHDTWEHERYTRNALFDQVMLSLTGAQAPNQGDVLLVGDIDEIPRVSTLTALRNCAFPPRVTLRTQMYHYSYQWMHRGELWNHPQATYFDGKNTVRPGSLRVDKADEELYMSGWHCDACFGTIEEFKNKITSFSHKGYNQSDSLDTGRILHRIHRGEDIFERGKEVYDRIENNRDIPAYLQEEGNRQKFAYMIDRDPPNANFRDIP